MKSWHMQENVCKWTPISGQITQMQNSVLFPPEITQSLLRYPLVPRPSLLSWAADLGLSLFNKRFLPRQAFLTSTLNTESIFNPRSFSDTCSFNAGSYWFSYPEDCYPPRPGKRHVSPKILKTHDSYTALYPMGFLSHGLNV